MNTQVKQILEMVERGEMTSEEALLKLKAAPFEDLGFAKIDYHRSIRQGVPEVIYGAGKTPFQISGILSSMQENGIENILITRLSEESAAEVEKVHALTYFKEARIGIFHDSEKSGAASQAGTSNDCPFPSPTGIGKIVVATGGTSDIPVAEEAAVTAEFFRNEVVRLYDVGVAGLHRLLAHTEELMNASAVVAIAGMEGALASVVGGLVDCPVIAVPTSVGYGTAFGGLSALLSMLNSCAAGVSVVNIDNGFGAGFLASRIDHIGIGDTV